MGPLERLKVKMRKIWILINSKESSKKFVTITKLFSPINTKLKNKCTAGETKPNDMRDCTKSSKEVLMKRQQIIPFMPPVEMFSKDKVLEISVNPIRFWSWRLKLLNTRKKSNV